MHKIKKRDVSNPLSMAKFPTIVENGKPRAFIIDIEKYRELELLVDNLINLRDEAEDELIIDSGLLEKLIAKAVEESKSSKTVNWEQELDEL